MNSTKKAMSPREARDRGMTGDHRPSKRSSNRQKKNQETPEEQMLRHGGWQPVVISPWTVLFMDPWGGQMVELEVALERERSRSEPTGEMLEVVGKGSKIPHDSSTGIPWPWGLPPAPQQKSKRQKGLEQSVPKTGRDNKTGEIVRKNRKWRRRNLQRN